MFCLEVMLRTDVKKVSVNEFGLVVVPEGNERVCCCDDVCNFRFTELKRLLL